MCTIFGTLAYVCVCAWMWWMDGSKMSALVAGALERAYQLRFRVIKPLSKRQAAENASRVADGGACAAAATL